MALITMMTCKHPVISKVITKWLNLHLQLPTCRDFLLPKKLVFWLTVPRTRCIFYPANMVYWWKGVMSSQWGNFPLQATGSASTELIWFLARWVGRKCFRWWFMLKMASAQPPRQLLICLSIEYGKWAFARKETLVRDQTARWSTTFWPLTEVGVWSWEGCHHQWDSLSQWKLVDIGSPCSPFLDYDYGTILPRPPPFHIQ